MIYYYNKLVRDKIPENIDKIEGRKASWRILNDDEYKKELDKKLIEEIHEFIEEHDIEELADVMEVIETIMKVENIQIEEVKEKQMMKRKKKGGMDDKIYLKFVEEDERNIEEERKLNKSWRKTSK